MNFRAFLVSRAGKVLALLVSAALAAALGWLGAQAPWLHAEALVDALGGQLIVTLLIMGGIREGLAWLVAHWACQNMTAVQVIQEALNEQLGAGLRPDGLLEQQTGLALDRALGSKVDLPIDRIPAKVAGAASKIVGLFVALLFLGVGVLMLPGCAVESPRLYVAIPHTGYQAYAYAGGGIAPVDPDAPAK